MQSIPVATASAPGAIRLSGDLGGTAQAPTVPGLAGKAEAVHTHTIEQVSGLDDALAGKADATHTHSQYATTTAVDGVSGRVSSLENSAPIIVSSLPASPLPGRIYLVTE